MTLRGRDASFVVVLDRALVRQVLRAPPERLCAGETRSSLVPVVGERSLVRLDGPDHIRERRLLLPAFHGDRLRAYETMMLKAADRAISSWPVGEPFALLPSMQRLTLEVIIRVVFGEAHSASFRGELERRVRSIVDPTPTRLGELARALTERRLASRPAERLRLLDELLYDEIARRRSAPPGHAHDDVLSTLLLARDEQGAGLDDDAVRDELVTLLVAGFETTATALAWAFALLAANPRVARRLRAALADGGDDYLDAVITEALRLRPLGPVLDPVVSRVVRGDAYELGEHLVPPGTAIQVPVASIHRRADLYPDPAAFQPERFLGAGAPDSYSWLPFGGGTRRCLGASFATLEMRVVIRRVMERATLSLAGPRAAWTARKGIMLGTGIMFGTRGGVRVVQPTPPRRSPAAVPSGNGAGTPRWRAASAPDPADTTGPPFVTVVITTRNRGSDVTTPVRTLLANAYPAFEIVVVDQSDGDSTRAALRAFDGEPRVRYVRTRTRGSAAGRNVGAAEGRGEIIAITDDDCEVRPDWLAELAAAFACDPRIGVVFGTVDAGPHDADAGFVVSFDGRREGLAGHLGESHRVDGVAACMGIRQSAWEACDGFDAMLGIGAPLRSAAEVDFSLRALRAGYQVYKTPRWSATHHGFRAAQEDRGVIDRYWYGTGAAMAKPLKLGEWSLWHLPPRLALRWARGRTGGVALGGRLHRWLRLAAFARGFAAGLATPVDPATGHYRPADG